MSTNNLRKRLSGLYYGWRMIGLVSALRVLGGGLHQYGFTVFFLPVTQDLGLTRASTSLAFSLARAEGSLAAPIVGYLIDRYGPRPMMFTAALLAGIGYILFSFVNSYATFLMVYLGVISLAFTAGFVHAPTVIANSWFIRLRARAMTVVSAAVPVGGALITPLLGIAVHTFGWRWAAFFAGVLFLGAGVPLCIGIKRSPESIGMAADGMPLQNASSEGSQGNDSHNQETEITARDAFRSPIFWNPDLLDDLPLGRVHDRDDSLHSDDGLERRKPDRSVGSARRICAHQFADSLSARLDRRFRQQAQAGHRLPVLGGRRRLTDVVERLALGVVVLYRTVQRARRIDTGLLGFGGRFLRPQILRRHPRQHESLLHLGRHLGPFRRRRDLRSHPKLRPRVHRHHDIAIDLNGDDSAADQTVGENRRDRSGCQLLNPFVRFIRYPERQTPRTAAWFAWFGF